MKIHMFLVGALTTIAAMGCAATSSDDLGSEVDEHAAIGDGEDVGEATAPIIVDRYISPSVTIPREPLLKAGLHPGASDRLRVLRVPASMVAQTVGDAAASQGSHLRDGSVNGHPYSAATDLLVTGLREAEIKVYLENLGRLGFAAFYRKPCYDAWPCSERPHIHAVYAGAPMKSQLDMQVHDMLKQENGLGGHVTYRFYTWSSTAKNVVREMFNDSNPGD